MDPVTAILGAAALAGAIIGGQRKHIDPNWLKANYGAHAVTQEAQELFARMVNSPVGQQIMTSASVQGQQFANSVNAKAAQAGMTPMGGAATGTGIFATGAGEGAANVLQGQARSDMYASVLPVAQDLVNQRRDAYLQDFYNNGAPTQAANTWSRIGNAAGIGLAAASTAKPAAPVDASKAGTIPGFQPKAVSLGQQVIGGPVSGMQLPQYNPQYSFLQKARRLAGNLSSRFATAFAPQQPRFS
jgi:hypothetical protein